MKNKRSIFGKIEKFSIRKYSVGVCSTLIGSLFLVFGSYDAHAAEVNSSDVEIANVTNETEKDTTNDATLSQKDATTNELKKEVSSAENINVNNVERTTTINYLVKYVDSNGAIIGQYKKSVPVKTTETIAKTVVTEVASIHNLPENYTLKDNYVTHLTKEIVEGNEEANVITFVVEKLSTGEVVNKNNDTVIAEDAKKEEKEARKVSIPYKVVQTDVETGEERKLGQVNYAHVTTTDEVAKAEVTVTADKLRSGYRLAEGQSSEITKVVTENESNVISFAVTRKKEEEEAATVSESAATTGFRTITNAPRSANTVSYVTTEWKVPNEAETVGANFDKAAGDASVIEATTTVPTAYKTTLPDGREVFMVLSLNSHENPNNPTTFNNKYNKDYFFQFSIAKEGEINKVYADLVDKRQSNKILESIEIAQGSTGKFNTLAQYEKDDYKYEFQFTPDPSNSTSKNLKINNINGGNDNTVIYDKVSPSSVGTDITIHNVVVPVRTTQETKYVVKATEKRPEETLATYIQKGALTGDSYTIAGALDFDKYELIAEDVPAVLKGDLAADYKVGAKTIQNIMTHNLVRVLEVTKKDGTHKAHIYLLNPDGPNRLALDRKTNITEADLTSENFIKFFTSEEIVPGKVNTLEGSYSYTSKHQFESYKTNPHTVTNVITGETGNFTRNGENFSEGNFFIPEHQAVTLKGKDGKPFGFGGVQMRMVNDNVANEQHVTYYYAEKGSVIIHYVNDKGETLKRSATLVGHGATGEQYDTRNYKHFSVFTGEGDAVDQYFLKGIDPVSSTLRPVTEDPNELRKIVKIDSETGAVERDTLKELTYVYEKAAKALVEIYLRPVDVETGAVSGPDKLDHTIREQGRKETIIPKRITLDILQNYIDRGYEVISDGFSNRTTYYDSIEDGVGTVAPSQVYKIILREKIKTVTPDAPKEPNTPIDPTNPTGPKYPEGVRATDLNESVKRTIKYQYEGGAEASPKVEETLTFTRTAKVNVVTGAIAYTPWTSADNDFNEVVSPTIDGYEADKPTVEAVQDVPHNAQDTEVIVTYSKDTQKATITYKDEGGQQLGAIDEVTGKSGEPINYTTTARITELTNQGYEVVRDGFTKDGGQVFDTDKATDQPFEVVVREKTVTVTPEDPKNPDTPVDPGNPDGPKYPDGVKESDLNQTVTRVIKYQYEDGSKAKDDVVETLTYKRTATVNLVTKEVTYGDWTSTDDDFDKVDTEEIAGYTAEKASVEAELDVPADAADKEIIVRYVKDAQKATITYKDEGGQQLGAIDEVTGKSGEPINYTTTARITELTNQGYEVVRDGFTKDGGQVYDTDKNTDQAFTVVVKAKVETVTPDNPKDPNTPVDPGNPDGPKWPDGVKATDLNEEVVRTIKYVDDKGNMLFADTVETKKFTRTATVNLVTKEVTYGEWTEAQEFGKVLSPVKEKYIADIKEVEGATVNATDKDITVVVTYKPLGSWIPVVPEGNTPIDPITYPNDPTDPTKPGTEVPTVPHIPGTKPVTPNPEKPNENIPLTPVDPTDPTKGYVLPPVPTDPTQNTPIVYVEEGKQAATITYKTDKETLKVDGLQGKSGEVITYSTEEQIKLYEKQGYELVTDGFKEASETSKVYDNDENTVQNFDIILREKVSSITPENPGRPGEPIDPNNPDGPKWPTDKGVDDVKRTITRTVTYVDDAGKEVSPGSSNSVTFTRTGEINHVTGEVTWKDWTTKDAVLEGTKNPVITGYIAKSATLNGTNVELSVIETDKTVSYNENNINEVVTYVKLGSWSPKLPNGETPVDPITNTPIDPITYPNDPTDPTKPGTEVPTIPYIPGYVPVNPDTNEPLKPVDPTDPTKGYLLPPVPTDPTKDITIPYQPNGSYVPVIEDPSNPNPPIAPEKVPYDNTPEDPSNNPPLPYVPGYVPVDPKTNEPLKQVDPEDPTKGYIPPSIIDPTDPRIDTPVKYVPNKPTVPWKPATPEKPIKPVIPTVPEKPINPDKSEKPATPEKSTLPETKVAKLTNTGEASSTTTAAGLGLLGIASVLLSRRKNRK